MQLFLTRNSSKIPIKKAPYFIKLELALMSFCSGSMRSHSLSHLLWLPYASTACFLLFKSNSSLNHSRSLTRAWEQQEHKVCKAVLMQAVHVSLTRFDQWSVSAAGAKNCQAVQLQAVHVFHSHSTRESAHLSRAQQQIASCSSLNLSSSWLANQLTRILKWHWRRWTTVTSHLNDHTLNISFNWQTSFLVTISEKKHSHVRSFS